MWKPPAEDFDQSWTPPSSDFEDAPVVETPEVSKLESFGRGGAQGLSFGFADEITGALESMISDKSYEQARDESRANYMKAEEANPMTSAAGNIAGAVAPAIAATVMTGGAAAPAVIPTLGRAVAIGAGQGAVDALGRSEADLTKGEFGGAAKDTTRGAAVGAVAGAAAKGLSSAADNLLPALKKLATEGGETALGLNTQSIKKMGVEKAEDVAEFALKGTKALDGDSIITPGSGTKAMWDKAVKVKDAAGSDVGSVLSKMDELTGPVPTPILQEIHDEILSHQSKIARLAPEMGDTAVQQYNKALSDFTALATDPKRPMTFKQLGEFKAAIGDIAYKHGTALESKAAFQDAYHAVNNGLDKAVEAGSLQIKNPALSEAYKSGKKAYDMSLRAIDGLEGKAAKEAGGKWVGFGDVMAGGLGAQIGGPVGMAAGIAAKRVIEARGAQTIGKVSFTAAEKLERALTANPQILGKYLPMLQQAHQRGQLAATNYVLQQRDPEYAETLKRLDEGDLPNE